MYSRANKLGLQAKLCIDVNCDVGESYGAYTIGNDEALMKLATSVNIACGFHAGDPAVMRRTVALAIKHGVSIGAHPGLPDRIGFGRRMMQITPHDVYDMTLYQIAALQGFVAAQGGAMRHVKPHGALYTMLASHEALAQSFAQAVIDFNNKLIVVGLAGSVFLQIAECMGLSVAHEAFADRRYQPDGSLTPRTEPCALVQSVGEAAAQAVRIAQEHTAVAVDGSEVPIYAQTICLHGDSPHSTKLARAVVRSLKSAGIELRAL
ncbi:MAG: LamB/YcsF family protein [Candidatus Kapabacteria bacterium]|nr:LamB/YcsF family protein [Candidatus Kapabacteria bacterium]